MPSSTKNHYDLLGVARNASLEEIKKRYRELARQLHPDVNPDKANASKQFSDVTTAYKVLSDTNARATYDAELSLQAQRVQQAQARNTTSAPRPANTTNAQGRPAQAQVSRNEEAARLVANAKSALVRMRYIEARDLAQQSLRLRRTAEGYEILGDVYQQQGKDEEALAMYTMALQLDPRNNRVSARVERLARSGSPSRMDKRYESASPRPSPRSSSSGGSATVWREEKRPIALLLVGVLGYGAVFLLLLYLAMDGRETPLRPVTPIPFLAAFNGKLLTLMPLCGFLLGATMAITQVIRRLDDELIFAGGGGRFSLPMGPLLLIFSLFSFWLAAILHLVVSTIQEARTDSILRVFGAVATLIALFSLILSGTPVLVPVVLFGGNLIFLAYALGWLIGDVFRPE